jgi:hypothetical protein
LIKFLLYLLVVFPVAADAAQCQGSDGKWYPYSHPMCSGGSTNFTTPQSPTSNSSTEWYSGGNLHKATVGQWRAASYSNKLATASDWLASTKWKGHLNTPTDFGRLKNKATILVSAVDEASTADKSGKMSVAEIAAAIMTIANDLGP